MHLPVPEILRNRAKYVSAKTGKSISDIFREGLEQRVDYLLHKIELDEAKDKVRLEEMQEVRRKRGRPPSITRLTDTLRKQVVAEQTEQTVSQSAGDVEPARDEKVSLIFSDYAKRVAAAVSERDINEQRVLVAECVAAVKRNAPLTSPSDSEIVQTLEDQVLKILAELEKAKASVIGEKPSRRVSGLAWEGDS